MISFKAFFICLAIMLSIFTIGLVFMLIFNPGAWLGLILGSITVPLVIFTYNYLEVK